MKGNLKEGNAILSIWMKEDRSYCMLEFRSAEEANNAFKLDGISILGKKIRIGRPRRPNESSGQPLSKYDHH